MKTTTTPLEQFLAMLQRLQNLQLLGIGRTAMKDMQLSISQLSLLLCINRAPGIRVNELAHMLELSAPTVSVALRKLEQEGWIQRKADPEDKRSFQLYLTRKASVFTTRAQDFQSRQVASFLEGLAPEEQAQLIVLLDKAITRLEQHT